MRHFVRRRLAFFVLLVAASAVAGFLVSFSPWWFIAVALILAVSFGFTFLTASGITAPFLKLRKDIDNIHIARSLNSYEYPFEEMREIAAKINNLATENRNAANMRRDFFANASHELKTPITLIKGSAELLCSDIKLGEKEQKELLHRIGLETDRMHRIINDIIMINRLESGANSDNTEEVNMAEVITECVDAVATLIKQNRLRLKVNLAQTAKIYANRKNIQEIFSNLIVNAVNYTRIGGRIEIELHLDDGELVFAIRNDGDAISTLHQNRIFERFYRLDNSRSKAVGGTGLGLAIVKHAVESLGGSIKLESSQRIGVLFTVTIPIKLPSL